MTGYKLHAQVEPALELYMPKIAHKDIIQVSCRAGGADGYLGYASPLQQRWVRAVHAEPSAWQASRKKGSTVGTMITHVTLHHSPPQCHMQRHIQHHMPAYFVFLSKRRRLA